MQCYVLKIKTKKQMQKLTFNNVQLQAELNHSKERLLDAHVNLNAAKHEIDVLKQTITNMSTYINNVKQTFN
ncbi:cyun5 [Cyclophragma undans nucleopolyhedrovirus]|uniref:Cyun5 n=1 Tax=Cyclophragma undans nucleopolyhedrovirus TaxID=1906244 RepID=A0A288QA57_9ABAC|nr:cyun5 [Cyclophragma undans nucleopolyhedrovirus]AOT85475.1 cyun5 [Cyclophragma undans nucleopolyhedrovirus]